MRRQGRQRRSRPAQAPARTRAEVAVIRRQGHDDDKFKDAKDPGCSSQADDDERDPAPIAPAGAPPIAAPPLAHCGDGRDNDQDGKLDAGQDPGCPTSADYD